MRRPDPHVVVAIDLDDTLYPELAYARSAVRVAATDLEASLGCHGLRECAERLLEETFPAPEPLQRALRALDIPCTDQQLNQSRLAMQAHRPDIALFGDVGESLDRLRREATVALISEGRSVTQRAKIDALGVTTWFDHIIVSEELPSPNGKLTGAPYRALLERFDSVPTAFMIGDNVEKDGRAAAAEGLQPMIVRRPGERYVHPIAPSNFPTFPSLAAAADEILQRLGRSVR